MSRGGQGARALEQFFEMLSVERNAAANTLAAYRTDLDDFEQFASHVLGHGEGVLEADAVTVRAYLGDLSRRGLSPRSQARKLSALRQFF